MASTGSFCVTIDTEPDCDVRWRRSDPLSFESVLVGIPELLRPIWDRCGVRPVYFVSPEVIADETCCAVLRGEADRGAEIATHLHGEYIEPVRKYDRFDGTASKDYPCYAYDADTERQKIRNLTDRIERGVGRRPVSYRAARYGADAETMAGLRELGYHVDSSVTPRIDWSGQGGPDHSAAPDQPYWVDPDAGGGGIVAAEMPPVCSPGAKGGALLEVPITIAGKRLPLLPDRWLFYRWLRPTHMTVWEMTRLVREFLSRRSATGDRRSPPVLNMMFHSMEVIPRRTPFVRTRMGQRWFLRRLERTVRYMLSRGLASQTLAEVYDGKLRQVL